MKIPTFAPAAKPAENVPNVAVAAGAAGGGAATFDPKVFGESSYDQVAVRGPSLAGGGVGRGRSRGGPVAGGRRSSKIGTGGPGLGFGRGDGGIPPEQRWSIIYNTGQSPEDYARQLDALGVELAVVSG